MSDFKAEDFSELTPDETMQFDQLAGVLRGEFGGARLALMRGKLDGEDVAMICIASGTSAAEGIEVFPVAVLVNTAMFERLTPIPDDEGSPPPVIQP